MVAVGEAGGNGAADRAAGQAAGWHKAAQLGHGSAQAFEIDFRHKLVKSVRRKIEAEQFQEVWPLHPLHMWPPDT